MSKPRHSGWLKFVEPLDEITPSALAGPGVSRPTATTAEGGSPVWASTDSNAWRSASRAAGGPSSTQLGVSHRSSTRNRPKPSRTVALVAVPPMSRPTTTPGVTRDAEDMTTSLGATGRPTAGRPAGSLAGRPRRSQPRLAGDDTARPTIGSNGRYGLTSAETLVLRRSALYRSANGSSCHSWTICQQVPQSVTWAGAAEAPEEPAVWRATAATRAAAAAISARTSFTGSPGRCGSRADITGNERRQDATCCPVQAIHGRAVPLAIKVTERAYAPIFGGRCPVPDIGSVSCRVTRPVFASPQRPGLVSGCRDPCLGRADARLSSRLGFHLALSPSRSGVRCRGAGPPAGAQAPGRCVVAGYGRACPRPAGPDLDVAGRGGVAVTRVVLRCPGSPGRIGSLRTRAESGSRWRWRSSALTVCRSPSIARCWPTPTPTSTSWPESSTFPGRTSTRR